MQETHPLAVVGGGRGFTGERWNSRGGQAMNGVPPGWGRVGLGVHLTGKDAQGFAIASGAQHPCPDNVLLTPVYLYLSR